MLRSRIVSISAIILLSLLLTPSLYPWGVDGHAMITAKAVESLPVKIAGFFSVNQDELIRLSNVPDWEWKASPKTEYTSSWHFLDIDMFDFRYPFDDFPRDIDKAKKLSESTNKEAGYLPWKIADFYDKLVSAFKGRDAESIVFYAGIISHFAGDSTMPLHATRNYNGDFTGNYKFAVENDDDYRHKGVHQRFELGLISEKFDHYHSELMRSSIAPCLIPEDVVEYAFGVIIASYYEKDLIIAFDKMAMRKFGIKPELNSFLAKADEYYDFMDENLGALLVRQLATASEYLASLWYSAWVRAGEPELPELKVKIEDVTPR